MSQNESLLRVRLDAPFTAVHEFGPVRHSYYLTADTPVTIQVPDAAQTVMLNGTGVFYVAPGQECRIASAAFPEMPNSSAIVSPDKMMFYVADKTFITIVAPVTGTIVSLNFSFDRTETP